MTSTLARGAIALALLGAPAAALAGDDVGGSGAAGEASGASATARGPGPADSRFASSASLTPDSRNQRAEFAPPSRRKLAVAGERLAAGQATKISGPALTYRTSRRGPVLEVAALGGGTMDDVPFLAHLGFGWKF